MKPKSTAVLLLALICLPLLNGRAEVELARAQPWGRAVVPNYTMHLDRDPSHTALSGHITFPRESVTAHPESAKAAAAATDDRNPTILTTGLGPH